MEEENEAIFQRFLLCSSELLKQADQEKQIKF